MKFYYINLDVSTDRRKFMEDQFQKLNIQNFERISAISKNTVNSFAHPDDLIDGKYICDPTEEKKYFKDCPNCCIERAVLQSHLKAIERGYENGDDYFVIFEDDTVISYDINYNELIEKYAPKDWECIQLLVSMPPTVNKLFSILQEHKALFIPWKMILPSAGAYIVSHNGAKNIIDKYKVDRKWRFKDSEYCRLSDAMLFQIMKTYTITFPMFYMNIDMGSLVHPSHLTSHQMGTNTIKNIIDKSGDNPVPFAKKII
tara:strand:+ start:8904 stop:9677 length:774 start_codon:yes stop_codon:yes gene_type:complete